MVRRSPLLDAFETEQIRGSPPCHAQAMRIFESLLAEARELGALPLRRPLEGIEVDLRLARALNGPGAAGADRPGA